jgi:hypothetical protein
VWQCRQTSFIRCRFFSADSVTSVWRFAGSVSVTSRPSRLVSRTWLIGGRFVQEIRSPGSCVTLPPLRVFPDMWQVAQVGACE